MEFPSRNNFNRINRQEYSSSPFSSSKQPPVGNMNGQFPMETIDEWSDLDIIEDNHHLVEAPARRIPSSASYFDERRPHSMPYNGTPARRQRNISPWGPERPTTEMASIYATLDENQNIKDGRKSKKQTGKVPKEKQKSSETNGGDNAIEIAIGGWHPNGTEAPVHMDTIKTKQREHKINQRRKRKECLCRLVTVFLFLCLVAVFPYAVVQYMVNKDKLKAAEHLYNSEHINRSEQTLPVTSKTSQGYLVTSVMSQSSSPGKVRTSQNVSTKAYYTTANSMPLSRIMHSATITKSAESTSRTMSNTLHPTAATANSIRHTGTTVPSPTRQIGTTVSSPSKIGSTQQTRKIYSTTGTGSLLHKTTITASTSARDACSSSPCQNGGTCRPIGGTNGYICKCAACECTGDAGTNCEKDLKTCAVGGPEYKAHPDDCGKYIRCTGRIPQTNQCSSPLKFNPAISNCDWSKNINCTSS